MNYLNGIAIEDLPDIKYVVVDENNNIQNVIRHSGLKSDAQRRLIECVTEVIEDLLLSRSDTTNNSE